MDYTWKVLGCHNPNKGWLVGMVNGEWTKLSALMSMATARKIATYHNMTLKYLDKQEPTNEA